MTVYSSFHRCRRGDLHPAIAERLWTVAPAANCTCEITGSVNRCMLRLYVCCLGVILNVQWRIISEPPRDALDVSLGRTNVYCEFDADYSVLSVIRLDPNDQ